MSDCVMPILLRSVCRNDPICFEFKSILNSAFQGHDSSPLREEEWVTA